MRALAFLLPALVLAMPLLAAHRVGVSHRPARGLGRAAELEGNEELVDTLLMQCAQHAALGEPVAVVVADEITTHQNRTNLQGESDDPEVLLSRCFDLISSGTSSPPVGSSCWPGGSDPVVVASTGAR